VLVDIKPAEVVKLFPPYLAGAIKRPLNNKPAVTMTLPNQTMSKFGCQMTLEVMDNKVQHIAKELFGAHVETTAGLQYVYLESGAKIVPYPRFMIQTCKREMIFSMFGSEIFDAITASSTYQDEIDRCEDGTQSVSLVISQAASDGGYLLLTLEPVKGTSIREKLYN
jgi:hypothetical protein